MPAAERLLAAAAVEPLLPLPDGSVGAGAGTVGAPSSARSAAAQSSVRRLGSLGVCAVLFASVAGGPYGIEAAVGAAGGLPTLVGCVALAALWSAPQALVAAELSCAFPSSGGSLGWVSEGLGPTAGFVAAANVLTQAATNLPLYPVLFASYVAQLAPGAPPWALAAAKLGTLAAAVLLNVIGLDAVSAAAGVLSLAVQAPFLALPVAALAYKATWTWSAAAATLPSWRDNASVFIAVIIWNSNGWINSGNLAGEVANPAVAYTRGSAAAVLLVALNYVYPVAVGVALAPDAAAWTTGYFADVGEAVAPWLGVWITVGAALSVMNNFIPQLATTARALRFTALYGMLPPRARALTRTVRGG